MAQHARSSRRLRSILWMAAIALLLLTPAWLWARAGGGEGYSGGGGGGGGGGGFSGGGGHSGGGGDGGGLINLLIQLFIYHPGMGITLLIFIAIAWYLYNQYGPQTPAQSAPLDRPLELSPAEAQAALAQMREHDPAFDEMAFYRRVEMAFQKIQAAWCAQNLATVRPFISDGVHERFTLQFAEQKAEGYRDVMENILIHHLAIAELHSDGQYDELSIRIDASAVDYHVSLANGAPLSGTRAADRFTEIWSFVRKRGAVTQPGKAGLIEGNCPNCGAAIELNQSANCTHCKALLRSGEFDWVVSEITQASEWFGARHDAPAIARFRQVDPNFNAVELEDRVSVIYWRKVAADRAGKVDPLRKMASEAFCQAYAPSLKPQPDGWRQMFVGCAVGSVELKALARDPQGDRAVAIVRWSAKRVAVHPTQPPRIVAPQFAAASMFVLWRQSTQSDGGKGISSAHCPTCGAPVSNDAAAGCEFCGTVLNDGAHGWILTDIIDGESPAAHAMLRNMYPAAAI